MWRGSRSTRGSGLRTTRQEQVTHKMANTAFRRVFLAVLPIGFGMGAAGLTTHGIFVELFLRLHPSPEIGVTVSPLAFSAWLFFTMGLSAFAAGVAAAWLECWQNAGRKLGGSVWIWDVLGVVGGFFRGLVVERGISGISPPGVAAVLASTDLHPAGWDGWQAAVTAHLTNLIRRYHLAERRTYPQQQILS